MDTTLETELEVRIEIKDYPGDKSKFGWKQLIFTVIAQTFSIDDSEEVSVTLNSGIKIKIKTENVPEIYVSSFPPGTIHLDTIYLAGRRDENVYVRNCTSEIHAREIYEELKEALKLFGDNYHCLVTINKEKLSAITVSNFWD